MAVLDGTSPTGAWSMYRDLLTSFVGGQRYTTATGVNQFTDQTGNARHLLQSTAANQPSVTTAGPNSRTCANFDGVNDALGGGPAMSALITATDGYIVASFILVTASGTNNANTWSNQAVFADNSGYVGTNLKSDGSISAANYDVGDKKASSAASAITTGTLYVVEWRHQGGNVYLRINGGSEISAASGNTGALTGQFYLAEGSGGYFTNIRIFELATWSTVPALATRNAIAANFLAQSTQVGGCSLYGVGIYGRALYSGCNYVACAGSLPLNFSLHALLDVPTEILLQGSLPLHFGLTGDVKTGSVYLQGVLPLRFSFRAPLTATAGMTGTLPLRMQMPSPLDVLVYTGKEWLPAPPCDQPEWTEDSCSDGVWQATDPCPPWGQD